MRKIKWGILGTANICEKNTIPGMMMADNVELYAVAGRSPEKVQRFQDKFGFKKTYLSYDELLCDPEVEAIYIPLPNTLHKEWTIKALNHKKHVLCEKPIAPTAADAKEMFDTAKENGVYLMEAFAYLHSPYVKALCDEVASGKIGKIKYMEASFQTSNYNMSNIRMRRETLGGAMYDLGVYSGSLILRILDEEPANVKAIAAFSKDHIDISTNAILEYASGAIANLSCGMTLATEKHHGSCRFEIFGENGAIKSGNFLFNGKNEQSYILRDESGVETEVVMDIPQNYYLEVTQFGRVIEGLEKPLVSEEFSLANARMVDAILTGAGY